LVYGIEEVLLIECEIPSLKLTVELLPHTSAEEERFLYLTKMDETRRDVALINETYQKRIKNQYDKSIQPCTFAEGDLVLVYDQDHDKLGAGKLEPMWHGPYIIKRVLHRRAYKLVDYDGISLGEPEMGFTSRSTMHRISRMCALYITVLYAFDMVCLFFCMHEFCSSCLYFAL
jgi:hypothetical protein